MELELIEWTDKNAVLKTYDIYKDCMYMPTEEKFSKKTDTFLNDKSVRIFACLCEGEIKGVIVISFSEQRKGEIVGIAVDLSARNNGIGTYMANELINRYGLKEVLAETDDDAVNFYRKSGFTITEFTENYDGETVTRYKCVLVK